MLASVLSVLALAAAQPDEAPAAAGAKAPSLTFKPETMVDGETLQVILGQRALFRVDDRGLPVLAKVEEGKLAAAHPEGQVEETFAAPPKGQLAAALDGSAEKRATVLKVWNGLDRPMDFRGMALVMRRDKLTPVPLNICAVKAGGAHEQSWPAPIVAVGLARFATAKGPDNDCIQGGS